jgi:hypothetical protein
VHRRRRGGHWLASRGQQLKRAGECDAERGKCNFDSSLPLLVHHLGSPFTAKMWVMACFNKSVGLLAGFIPPIKMRVVSCVVVVASSEGLGESAWKISWNSVRRGPQLVML